MPIRLEWWELSLGRSDTHSIWLCVARSVCQAQNAQMVMISSVAAAKTTILFRSYFMLLRRPLIDNPCRYSVDEWSWGVENAWLLGFKKNETSPFFVYNRLKLYCKHRWASGSAPEISQQLLLTSSLAVEFGLHNSTFFDCELTTRIICPQYI